MTTRILIGLAVLLLAGGQPAFADGDTGWAFSAGLGGSRIRDVDGDETFSGNGFGLAADLEYRVYPRFVLGLGVFSLGTAEDTVGGVDTEIDVWGYEVLGRVIFPVTETAEVYARISQAVYRADVEPGAADILDALVGDDATGVGLGIDFGRREKLGLRLEGRYYNGGEDETGALLLFGLNYQF